MKLVFFMRIEGVEPSHLAVYAPETHASAYSATGALLNYYSKDLFKKKEFLLKIRNR